jgi:hypothetical protein
MHRAAALPTGCWYEPDRGTPSPQGAGALRRLKAMPRLSWAEIRENSRHFTASWEGVASERAESQTFWNEFFEVFGLRRRNLASFEEPVRNIRGQGGRIDLFWRGVVLVEHKSAGKRLDVASSQAFSYVQDLVREGREDEVPRYVIVSDFARFALYDLEPEAQDESVLEEHEGRRYSTSVFPLSDLHRHIKEFGFIRGDRVVKVNPEDPANEKAYQRMCQLHDELKEGGFDGPDLERLLVRVLFCLFAEDTGIFEPNAFLAYVLNNTNKDGSDLGAKLNEFFEVLNTAPKRRQHNLHEDLAVLPYVNGALFADRTGFASFTRSMRDALIAAAEFHWAKVSPAVFGSLFQGIMESGDRRQLGAHYTSERDIMRVISSLFLDELRADFNAIRDDRSSRRLAQLETFQSRLRSLRFLDPACGCGNFLIVAYRELRALEHDVLRERQSSKAKQQIFELRDAIQVDIDQFYGIEILEWPVRIAEVAMWLMDHQMNQVASDMFSQSFERLPLKSSPHIVHGNALQLDWASVLPPDQCSYILGNPPFVGQKTRNADQAADLRFVWGDRYSRWLDYVSGWYWKAENYLAKSPHGRAAFVSTNSVTQGEQVGRMWQPLVDAGIVIDFAHRTFSWSSEAKGKAHVHVVIVGFSPGGRAKTKVLFDYDDIDGDPVALVVSQINPYLVCAPSVLVHDRTTPLSKCLPGVSYGNKPADGGFLIVDDGDRPLDDPIVMKYLRRYLGAQELLHDERRWCLWLVDAEPSEVSRSKFIRERVEKVRKFRSESSAKDTRKSADQPARFFRIPQPSTNYIAIPRHVSENRRWFTVGYFRPEVIASDAIYTAIDPDGVLFGLLSSRMFIAWLRSVGGAIKSDLRFSGLMVYNTFPISEPTAAQREQIVKAGAEVLSVREKFPSSSLADLYDPVAMPGVLAEAHSRLDRVVDRCYRPRAFQSDRERVEHLFELYGKLSAPLLPPEKKRRQILTRQKSP